MSTVKKVKPDQAEGRVRAIYDELEQTLGFVPHLYQALANSPAVLDAIWTSRLPIMSAGELDATTKQWLAFAALVFSNNPFSLHAHMNRLRQRGVTDRAFAEAVGVLSYFGGLGIATNAFGMHQDFNPEMPRSPEEEAHPKP